MEPLRSWKELFLGERAYKPKKSHRSRRRYAHNESMIGSPQTGLGE
jgi:hypothetical protein